MDLSVLDNIIIGRVDPHIYAFTTNTVPNYLKVGDTYRPVSIRLQEWREHFPDLQKEYEVIAKVDDSTYFRDFAVHYFLENEKEKERLLQSDLPAGVYFSKEFFKEASAQDVIDAVDDILHDYSENGGKYQFYNADTRLPETHTYERTETYDPRPNQDVTIRRFKEAVDAGRTNLLMYAVMRFGKSFTSMCCAVEMGADIVAVVSAKADVKEEWKKTVESHIKFSDYTFLTSDNLASDERAIRRIIDDGKKVVIFLTLQDLQGEAIKDKHREVFGNTIDLLIVDETHFGARAEKYGQVLRAPGYEKDIKHKKQDEDYIDATEADEQIKVLDARIKLHLSGTPYRILMGSEFSKEDIIAFYQFTDIVKEQEKWIKDNNDADEPQEEWNNPYFGFPQMIRFAFNPNESSQRRLKELRESGITYAFSALLKPCSVKRSNDGSHKKFVFEQEILDLLEVIDGSKDDNELLGFLDYDRIKSGNMCRHIVMVLPYCASCDAMEELILSNIDKFKNLNDFEIINISGVDRPNEYRSSAEIKRRIRQCELEGKKTITLTVNRMLTGSTVEEWDTMLFLKDTASPQEYDQAVFRLQNQYVKKYAGKDGNTIKYNMKPQTLLVDFMPGRMFSMQEQKSQIYNVNVDEAGNSRLEERIREELRISPIVVVNSGKMEQVRAADILHAVSEYSKTRGVAEEATEIPVDLSLMDIDAIRAAIEKENELGSKQGFSTKAHDGDGDGTDMDIPDDTDRTDDDTGENRHNEDPDTDTQTEQDRKNTRDPSKQIKSYYARILFFAFLTKDVVISLEDIIEKIDTDESSRIARHIGISKSVLEAIFENINKFVLRDLDYSIQRLNRLSHDDTVDPIERANVAVRKFGKLGESEVITPKKICDEMVALIPDAGLIEAVQKGHKILDIAGKAGEFALSVYERMKRLEIEDAEIADAIYTIPTSGITYEFTRMVYEILGLNVHNLSNPENLTSYRLLDIKNHDGTVDYEQIKALLMQNKPFDEIKPSDDVVEGDEKVKFDVVIGNPPYQERAIGDNKGFTPPIYDKYLDLAYCLSDIAIMIHPARFLFNAGSTPKEWNKKMLESDCIKLITYESDASKIFPGTAITGGIAITEYNKNKRVLPIGIYVPYKELNSIRRKVVDCREFVSISTIISGRTPYLFTDVFHRDNPYAVELLSDGHMYDISSNAFSTLQSVFLRVPPINSNDYCRVLGRLNNDRAYCWIKKEYVRGRSPEYINTWKVFLPKANGASGTLGDEPARLISKPVVGRPCDIATDTFICVGAFNNEESANSLYKYMNGKFARILLGILKVTQDNTADKWEYVPMQDFTCHSDIDWSKSIADIDKQLYAKYGLTPDEIAFIESKVEPME